jgi:hypothetical protein
VIGAGLEAVACEFFRDFFRFFARKTIDDARFISVFFQNVKKFGESVFLFHDAQV